MLLPPGLNPSFFVSKVGVLLEEPPCYLPPLSVICFVCVRVLFSPSAQLCSLFSAIYSLSCKFWLPKGSQLDEKRQASSLSQLNRYCELEKIPQGAIFGLTALLAGRLFPISPLY